MRRFFIMSNFSDNAAGLIMWLYQASICCVIYALILLKFGDLKETYVIDYRAQEGPMVALLACAVLRGPDLWIHVCLQSGEVLAGSALVLQWRRKFPARRLLIYAHDAKAGAEAGSAKSFPLLA